MFLNFLATASAAIVAVGLVLIAYRSIGKKPPRWMLPAAAGLAMFGYYIWNDYSWYSRTAAALPPQIEVADSHTTQTLLQPWTYLVPRTSRFAAIDRASIKRNPNAAGYVLAEVILVTRYMPTAKILQIFDCEQPRRADVSASTEFDPTTGLPKNPVWQPLEADDRMRAIACRQ